MSAVLSRGSQCLIVAGMMMSLAGSALLAQNKDLESRRPKITLRAQPAVAIAPARVILTAEIVGGADDFEEYYCPSIEWEWGDDTSSESSADCDPYEAGKSAIKRRYTIQHVFRREGPYKVYIHLKKNDKVLASASATIQVQPGAARPY